MTPPQLHAGGVGRQQQVRGGKHQELGEERSVHSSEHLKFILK